MNVTAPHPALRRLPWLAVGVLLGVVLLIAAFGRAGLTATTPSLSNARATVQLRFADRSDGGVDVLDTAGRRVSQFAPTTNGFARSVVRSFTRERRRSGIGPEQPFALLQRADGGISLHDPTTGRQVSLDAFGPDNLRVFAALLQAAKTRHDGAST